MSKPVTVPTWDTNLTNTLPPDAGHITDGWDFSETPTSTVFNYLQNLYGAWLQYLNNGNLVGNHTIDGSLVVGNQALVIPSTVFTADNTTETFTKTAHGFGTGYGPIRVSTTSALPTGLTAGTDYWILVIDANTFHLSLSLADAFAGYFVSISTNGTGVQSLVSTVSTLKPTNTTVSAGLLVGGVTTANGPVVHKQSVSFLDSNGNKKNTVDRLGFVISRVADFSQTWLLTSPAGWTTGATGTGAALQRTTFNSGPVFGLGFNFTNTGVGQNVSAVTSASVVDSSSANTLVVVEWAVITTGFNTASTFSGSMGMNGNGVSSNLLVQMVTGTANWQLLVENNAGTITTINSGVPIVDGTVYRFRLELVGANQVGGARGTLYINNVRVVNQTTSLPNGVMKLGFVFDAALGAEVVNVKVSPVNCQIPYLLSDDVL